MIEEIQQFLPLGCILDFLGKKLHVYIIEDGIKPIETFLGLVVPREKWNTVHYPDSNKSKISQIKVKNLIKVGNLLSTPPREAAPVTPSPWMVFSARTEVRVLLLPVIWFKGRLVAWLYKLNQSQPSSKWDLEKSGEGRQEGVCKSAGWPARTPVALSGWRSMKLISAPPLRNIKSSAVFLTYLSKRLFSLNVNFVVGFLSCDGNPWKWCEGGGLIFLSPRRFLFRANATKRYFFNENTTKGGFSFWNLGWGVSV